MMGYAMDRPFLAKVGRREFHEDVKETYFLPFVRAWSLCYAYTSLAKYTDMSYSQVPCMHGYVDQLLCPSCMPQWQRRDPSTMPLGAYSGEEWQRKSTPTARPASSARSSMSIPREQPASDAAEAADAGTDDLALSFPSQMQASVQNRQQIQQRFDDLHM